MQNFWTMICATASGEAKLPEMTLGAFSAFATGVSVPSF